jgi:hypothetical protein
VVAVHRTSHSNWYSNDSARVLPSVLQVCVIRCIAYCTDEAQFINEH